MPRRAAAVSFVLAGGFAAFATVLLLVTRDRGVVGNVLIGAVYVGAAFIAILGARASLMSRRAGRPRQVCGPADLAASLAIYVFA